MLPYPVFSNLKNYKYPSTALTALYLSISPSLSLHPSPSPLSLFFSALMVCWECLAEGSGRGRWHIRWSGVLFSLRSLDLPDLRQTRARHAPESPYLLKVTVPRKGKCTPNGKLHPLHSRLLTICILCPDKITAFHPEGWIPWIRQKLESSTRKALRRLKHTQKSDLHMKKNI